MVEIEADNWPAALTDESEAGHAIACLGRARRRKRRDAEPRFLAGLSFARKVSQDRTVARVGGNTYSVMPTNSALGGLCRSGLVRPIGWGDRGIG